MCDVKVDSEIMKIKREGMYCVSGEVHGNLKKTYKPNKICLQLEVESTDVHKPPMIC